MNKRLKVLVCSSEVAPFAKTGGLADVTGELPIALEKLGVDVRIILPKYKMVKVAGDSTTVGKNIKVYFVENKEYFDRDYLYGDKVADYPDNLERFIFFSKAVFERIKKENFRPDIIHCNDWQTALVAVYLKTTHTNDPFLKGVKTIFTIHNLAYQGLFAKEKFPLIGLDWKYFNMKEFEFYDKINLLKAGIVFSDIVSTVSPTYSHQIQTKEFGCGLEGVLHDRRNDLYGILNGIDYDVWNPATDKLLSKNYSYTDIENKSENKLALQRQAGIDVDKNMPLIGYVGRLVDQKGVDLIAADIDTILNLKTHFVLLATGENKYHILFEELKRKFTRQAAIFLKYDAILAQKIYGAADFFLMPSRFEPCGLGQMISMRYGTIPVVHKTGGLADTVVDYTMDPKKGNGFVFDSYDPQAFLDAIRRSLRVYYDKKLWKDMVIKTMKLDFSWQTSAKKYVEVYTKLVAR